IELAHALREHPDETAAGEAYRDITLPALRERYALATELDAQRLRMWRGDVVAFDRQDGDYALFSVVAAGAVASTDPEVFRVFVRRMGLLDSTHVLDDDLGLRRRIEERFRALGPARPAAGPDRTEMLA